VSQSITTLPVELQQSILIFAGNPLQASLVCQSWHQLSSDEPFYRSILSTIQSSMNEVQFTQLLRNFHVQQDAPAITRVQQLFKGVYQLRREYFLRGGMEIGRRPSDSLSPIRFHEALQSIKVLEEKEIENHLNEFLEFLETNSLEAEEFFLLQQGGMSNAELAKKMREHLFENTTWSHLQGLYFEGVLNNRSIVLPRFIRQCVGLTTLSIVETTNEELPKEAYHCVSLSNLCIRSNRLKKLSNEINNLKQLTMLIAFDNQISELPQTIGELKKLSYIDLEMNPLKRVPRSLLRLPNLNCFILESSWKRTDRQSLEDFLIMYGIEIYD
jgi:hypothetical protein